MPQVLLVLKVRLALSALALVLPEQLVPLVPVLLVPLALPEK